METTTPAAPEASASTAAPEQTQSTSVSTEKPVIKVPAGGSINRRDFAKAIGLDLDKDDDDSDEGEEETTEEDVREPVESEDEEKEAKTPTTTDDEEEAETTESEEESESEDDEKAEKVEDAKIDVKGRALKLKLEDGRELKLPANATILHKVDGELKEINLSDAINREVGYLTVEQRLTKVANLERDLNTKMESMQSAVQEQEQFLKELSELSVSKTPEMALAKLGARMGKTPGQMMEALFMQGLQWAEAFHKMGGDMNQIKAHFNNVDLEWYKQRDAEAAQKAEAKQGMDALNRAVLATCEQSSVSPGEWSEAFNQLAEEGILVGRTQQDAINMGVQRALQLRHIKNIEEAVGALPEAEKYPKLKATLMRVTNPQDYTVEDLKDLVKTYIQDTSGTKLSEAKNPVKRPSVPQQKVGAKTNQKIRNVSDLRRAFGIR